MKRKLIVAALTLGTSLSAGAADINLDGLGFVQYGDAQSYSLPVANYQITGSVNCNNCFYSIDSTPGAIQDLTVLGTGSEGQPVTTNTDGMDNAYSTPSGVGGETFFYPNLATYRGTEGTVANNVDTTWDTSLAALQTFLDGEQMVVFFNNNQVNSTDTSDQSLAAWARVWITDAAGNVIDGSTFEFTNMDGSYNLVSQGGGGQFLGDVTTYTATGDGPGDPSSFDLNGDTDYVLSGGQLCVATGGILPVPVPVPCGSDPTLIGGTTISSAINHNLGADHVAYAILFPELNALLEALFGSGTDLTNYTLHADIRLGCEALNTQATTQGQPGFEYGSTLEGNWMECGIANDWGDALNNGYEQIFIGTATVQACPAEDPICNPVPEPNILALVAIGLLSLGAMASRRRNT